MKKSRGTLPHAALNLSRIQNLRHLRARCDSHPADEFPEKRREEKKERERERNRERGRAVAFHLGRDIN